MYRLSERIVCGGSIDKVHLWACGDQAEGVGCVSTPLSAYFVKQQWIDLWSTRPGRERAFGFIAERCRDVNKGYAE